LVVIEHNPEVIKSADWVIDLGPDGGDNGGTIIFEGTPEALTTNELSFTAAAIKDKVRL
jgi:excinuclease ABC subunit A